MGNGPFLPRFIKEKALKNVPLCTSSEVETTNLRFFERNLANRGRRTLSPPTSFPPRRAFFSARLFTPTDAMFPHPFPPLKTHSKKNAKKKKKTLTFCFVEVNYCQAVQDVPGAVMPWTEPGVRCARFRQYLKRPDTSSYGEHCRSSKKT